MGKKKADGAARLPVQLPRGALYRIDMGDSFAEYDRVLQHPWAFVQTPASYAAANPESSKCFFVGRRGTGKTAITCHLASTKKSAVVVNPQAFVPSGEGQDLVAMRDARNKLFKTLVSSYKRAMLLDVVASWDARHLLQYHQLPGNLRRERNLAEMGFDLRLLAIMDDLFGAYKRGDREWVKQVNRVKELAHDMNKLAEKVSGLEVTLLIDRIDEAWDGSDKAVVYLMGLMHACVDLNAAVPALRALLFLRENIYQRVRDVDNEFGRLEASVVSLDWTQELLLELVERRLNLPFGTRLPLRGPTWDYFFEGMAGQSSRHFVLSYCQERPRDLLSFCRFAIDSAKSHRREKVAIEDIQEARKSFSERRLKELSEEYSENYPQLQLVLSRFYALGRIFVLSGITALMTKLLVDEEVKAVCGGWIYDYTVPERFVYLLYNIGFLGLGEPNKIEYRSLGAGPAALPPITNATHLVVHPSYADALHLSDTIVSDLPREAVLRTEGALTDVPVGMDVSQYVAQLASLEEELKSRPCGPDHAAAFEDLVGNVIRLCFFAWLTNVEPKRREVSKTVIRDWIASNRASSGFWEMVRHRYHATQVVWECKNYEELAADDFHQGAYYMTREIGQFAILVFRGEIKQHYYQHVKRISADKNGVVLLLTDKDLRVFLRQAKNGKIKESHIQERYDATVREIS